MKLMHQTLNEWWSPWSSNIPEQDGVALPSDVEMGQLENILQTIVYWTLSLKEDVGQTNESLHGTAPTTFAQPADVHPRQTVQITQNSEISRPRGCPIGTDAFVSVLSCPRACPKAMTKFF